MKKRWILMLALMAVMCLLTGCQQSSERFEVKSSRGDEGAAAQSSQQNMPNAEEDYDPLAEEDDYWEDVAYWQNLTAAPTAKVVQTPAPTIRSEYPGATPVLIDPIDKPTPTPVPPLSFDYQVYDATKLGISFEGPMGWLVNDSASDTFIIQNPDQSVKYYATLTIRAEKVSTQYSTSQLEQVVKNMTSAIGTAGFDDYDVSSTDSRTLLGQKGIYANYSGVLSENGERIAGRVQAACVDKVLYTIHITYPYAYRDTYVDQVFHHMRDTIKVTR